MLFWLFAVGTVFWSSTRPPAESGSYHLAWATAGIIGILFISVLLHELGHFYAAVQFGGDSDLILLWPLGGLNPPRPPFDSRQELAVHLAGPLVNAALCAAAGCIVAVHEQANVVDLLNPFAPRNLLEPQGGGPLLVAAKLTCWINCVLWLANLLPAFPFDGGRALRAGILAARPDFSTQRALFLVTSLAKIVAVVLVGVALVMWSDESPQAVPVWLSLVLLAMMLYFSARQEEERTVDDDSEDRPFGYDFSQGFTSLERSSRPEREPAGLIRRWLDERRSARLQQQRELELEEEKRADEILGRLHEHGLNSLSAEERSLLDRVSRRYRHRQDRTE
jgi:Zn-dependent protease